MYVSKGRVPFLFISGLAPHQASATMLHKRNVQGLCMLQQPTLLVSKAVQVTSGISQADFLYDTESPVKTSSSFVMETLLARGPGPTSGGSLHGPNQRFLCCSGAMVLAMIVSLALLKGCGGQLESQGGFTYALQANVFIYNILMFMTFTAVTPEAYDVVNELGFDAVDSGWLMGSCWAMVGLTSLTVKYLTRNWQAADRLKIFPVAVTFMPVFLLMAAVLVEPPTFIGNLSNRIRFNLIIFSRLLVGLVDGCFFLQGTMVISTLTPAQLPTFNLILICCRTLAVGMGPFASGLVCFAADVGIHANGAIARFSMIQYGMAIMWTIYVCSNWWVFARASTNSVQVNSVEDEQICQLDDSARKSIWWAGVAWGIERAFLGSALESAVSFILRVDSHWKTTIIGMAIGGSVMATMPFICMVWTVQERCTLSQPNLMIICAACVAIVSMIFFPQIAAAEHAATPYLTLLGFWMTLSAGLIASSIIASLAMRCALPGTYYTVENLLILDSLVEDSVCKLLAPPFARYLLTQDYGHTMFASLQAIVCILGFAHLRSAAQKCPIDGHLSKPTMIDTS